MRRIAWAVRVMLRPPTEARFRDVLASRIILCGVFVLVWAVVLIAAFLLALGT